MPLKIASPKRVSNALHRATRIPHATSCQSDWAFMPKRPDVFRERQQIPKGASMVVGDLDSLSATASVIQLY